jgi:hypothetical protein
MLLGILDRGVAGEPEHLECAVSYGHIQPKRIPDNKTNRECILVIRGAGRSKTEGSEGGDATVALHEIRT